MVSAVVLAAGASTRMGTQKLLLPLGDEPLVRRTVRQVCAAGFDDVLVVLGSEHEATLAALDGLPVRHAINMQFDSGMGSSFRTAVEHLPDSDAAMFALADQPFVTTTRVPDGARHLPPARAGHRQRPVRRGHGAAPSVRARVLPRARPARARRPSGAAAAPGADEVLQFPPDLLVDIDTPEDYELAKSRFSSGAMKAAAEPLRNPPSNPRRIARISPRIDSATSSGVSAPSDSPTGLRTAASRRRHPARSPAPRGRPAASRSANAARARRCRRRPIRGEAQAFLIALDVVIHDEREGSGRGVTRLGEAD